MSDLSYEDILNQSWGDVPEPKTLPNGSWRLKGKSAQFRAPKGQVPATAMFIYQAVEPMDDVDEDALRALGENYDYATKPIFFTIWLETGADFDAVRKHLAKHGVDVSTNAGIKESLKAFRGKEIVALLDKRTFVNAAGEEKDENTASQFTPVE